MRLSTDDGPRRWSPVWYGVRDITWPWHARYLAWCVWAGTFTALLIAEAVTFGVPGAPVWEFVISLLITNYLMTLVDHDRPLRSVWVPFLRELNGPRTRNREAAIHITTSRVHTNRGYHQP